MEFVFVCVASRYPSLTSKIASQTQVCHDVGKHDKSRNRVPFMIILREIFSITPWQYRPVTNFTLWQHMCRILQSVQKCNKKPNFLFMILLATIDHLPCLFCFQIFLLVRKSTHVFATDTIFANCFSLNFLTFQQSLSGFGLVPLFGHQSICAVYIYI